MSLKLSFSHLVCLLIGAASVASIQSYAQLKPMPTHMILPHGPVTEGSIKMNQKVSKPMRTPMSGNTDKDFAMMMAEYQSREIELSQLEIRYGRRPRLKKIARFLVGSQSRQRDRLQTIGESIP